MSGVAQVTNRGAPAPALEEIVYKATPGRRISLAGQAEHTAQAVEGVRADFQAKIDRLERENAALRREAADMQARSVDAAVATGAALQAQSTTIESLTATNTALRRELGEARSTIARFDSAFDEIKEFASPYGSTNSNILRNVKVITGTIIERARERVALGT